MQLKAYVSVAIAVIIWGIAPAFIRDFSTTIGPWDSVFIRMISVAIMCLPFMFWSGVHIDRQDMPRLLLVSCVGIFGYFIGSIYGFTYVKTGIGGIMMAIQPLIISLLAAAIGTQRLTLDVLAGIIISFAGAVYMFSGDMGLDGAGTNTAFGIAMLLLCDVAFAINVVYSRALVQKYGPLRITILTMILAAIPALAFFRPGVVDVIHNLDRTAWGTLFFLGFIGTILVVIVWNRAVGLLPPATVGASLYVIPVLAALSGFLILGETLPLRTLIGGAIILAGVAISEFGRNLLRPIRRAS